MPGMHIRYNETALRYEYSTTGTDQGPWLVLPLANNVGSGDGSFDKRVVITPNTGSPTPYYGLEIKGNVAALGGKHAGIVLNEQGGAVDAKKWRILNYNNNLEFERLNDAETAVQQKTVTINPDGTFKVFGNLLQAHGRYLYPGRIDLAYDGVNAQASWIIAGHGSYGLYANTGLYLAGGLWTENVDSRTWVSAGSGVYTAQGIYFTAAQNNVAHANNLDDYEEGSWTPAIPGATHTTYGRYVKIGSTVKVAGLIQCSNKGAQSGHASILGMPFAVRNAPDCYDTLALEMTNITFPTIPSPVGRFQPGTGQILLYNHTQSGAAILTFANLLNNTQIIFGGTYFTD